MKLRYLMILFIFSLGACDDDYFHDTGLANGRHDCTVWEYLHKDSYNWDSTILVIERAGLVDLFDGKDPAYPAITFFGPTNFSIMQFMYKTVDSNDEMLYNRIADIPADMCRKMILCHVLPKKMMKEEFDYEVKGTLEGGTYINAISGTELRVFRAKSSYMGIADIGAESLGIHALTTGFLVGIASADIEMNNGVVHSLSYSYQFSEL